MPSAKTIGLAAAGLGTLAAFGFLKWKLLRGGNAWWAIILGGILFAATTSSATSEGEQIQ